MILSTLISNGVSQHRRCIRGKGVVGHAASCKEFWMDTWRRCYAVKTVKRAPMPSRVFQAGSVPLSTLLTFASRGARHLECRGTWAPSHHGSIGPVGPCATGDATRRGSAETMAQRAWEDLCLPWERLVWAASYLCYLLPQKERILWVWYDRRSSRLLGPVNIPRLSMWSKNRLRPRCGSPSAGRTAAKSGQGIGDRHNT